jgi:hypothetical protein
MLRVTALIKDAQLCLVTAHYTDQRSGFMVLAKMGAKTALSVLNRFHVSSVVIRASGMGFSNPSCPQFKRTTLLFSVNHDWLRPKYLRLQ